VSGPGGVSAGTIVSVRTGRAQERPRPKWDRRVSKTWVSAFGKQETPGPVRVTTLGLEGDEQVDRRSHGGQQMAVLAYCADHYPLWREIPGLEAMGPGGFAENLTVQGLEESTVRVGDVYEAGGVRLQVSQPRGPCANISRWWNEPSMVKRATATSRVGWYLRVLREGTLARGEILRLLERPRPEWTIARVFRLRVGLEQDLSAVAALVECPELSPEWQGHFREIAAEG